jgi:hypothetical protein
MTRRVQGDDHYNRRFDNTGYQRPPEGPPVFTTETPTETPEQEKARLEYFRSRTPDPIDKDVPKDLAPRQDATGQPYLVEVALRKEAEASIALDGETQTIEEVQLDKDVEAVKRVVAANKNKETTVTKKFTLKLGEQTNTVVDLLREHGTVGDRFNVNLLYGWFTPGQKDRWRKAYGDQAHVKDRLLKAITNVAWSGNHLRLVVVKNAKRTWVLESKSGSSLKAPRMKPAVKVVEPKTFPEVPETLDEYALIGRDLNDKPLYRQNSTEDIGYLVFVSMTKKAYLY